MHFTPEKAVREIVSIRTLTFWPISFATSARIYSQIGEAFANAILKMDKAD